jgi:hypothetical protein
LDLFLIGRPALVWKHRFAVTTYDVDVIGMDGEGRLMTEAIRLFGHNTPKAREHGLYLQLVPSALPPVPAKYRERATESAERWPVIRLYELDDHDLAVTKLGRFVVRDQQDLRDLCDLGVLDPEILAARFEGVMHYRRGMHVEDPEPEYVSAFANLRVVQKYLNEGVWG